MTEYLEKKQTRRRRNAYMIIAAVILLFIIAILVMKSLFQDRLEALRAAEAKSTIQDIFVAADEYEFQQGKWPFNLNDLEDLNLWFVDKKIYRNWTFYLLGDKNIRAISTYEMAGGSGMIVNYDIRKDLFTGYGCLEEGEKGHFDELID